MKDFDDIKMHGAMIKNKLKKDKNYHMGNLRDNILGPEE
jgi:hypothetical protein